MLLLLPAGNILNASEMTETCFSHSCLRFQLSPHRALGERRSDGKTGKVDHYKREPLESPKNGRVIPSISIIFQHFGTEMDPLQYNILMRSKLPLKKIDESFYIQPIPSQKKQETVDDENNKTYKFLGFKGTFHSNGIKFVQYIITATDRDDGITVVITCTQDLFDQIEDDVDLFIKTLVYSENAQVSNTSFFQ